MPQFPTEIFLWLSISTYICSPGGLAQLARASRYQREDRLVYIF